MKAQTSTMHIDDVRGPSGAMPGRRAEPWGFLENAAIDLGMCAIGVSDARPIPSFFADAFARWLARGDHAGMGYMARNVEKRLDVGHDAVMPGADVVVSAALPYANGAVFGGFWSCVAAFARGADYHLTMRRVLEEVAGLVRRRFAGASTRVFVDSAPVMERTWAALAGLGTIGANGALSVPGVGPRVVLGEIAVTGAPHASDGVFIPLSSDSSCARCGRCARACPTGALRGDGTLDARRCLAYHTAENTRADIPSPIAREVVLAYGCDACTDACPKNAPIQPASRLELPPAGLAAPSLAEIASMDDARLNALFAKTCMARARAAAIRRNADLALRNRARERETDR